MKYRIIVGRDGSFYVQKEYPEFGWHTVSSHETKQQATTIMDELVASARADRLKQEAYDKLVAEGKHIVAEETV